ncbi:dual oxidase maturation factor 1-like [Aethina tumida]|uniref:dual oxidase maturation factor 1-like n=1 Tax=Aethina tumida TaxID=116153 RepID=UPI0021496DB0|nr:dual oxidase maturation factor 1-like [Aethina tumida]
MWFSLGRNEGFPTIYGPNQTPVTVDVLEAGFLTAFLILLLTFLVSFVSSKVSKTFSNLIHVVLALLIGLLLLLGNFGQEWEVGHIKSKTSYKAGSPHEIDANIAVKIGLRSVNVTLNSDTKNLNNSLKHETIDYNERFEWTWDQGRFGFGPYAGKLQQEFRAAQYRGLPTPILWIVDYFVIDGEGYRHGRFYRTAGWYSHILMWTAFATWLTTVILCRSVIGYAAFFLGLTGALQLTANLVWLVVRNPSQLVIPFEDAEIRTKFGISYWITFVNGILCVSLAITMFVLSKYYEKGLQYFFCVETDDYRLLPEEQMVLRKKNQYRRNKDELEMNPIIHSEEDPEIGTDHSSATSPPPVERRHKPKFR